MRCEFSASFHCCRRVPHSTVTENCCCLSKRIRPLLTEQRAMNAPAETNGGGDASWRDSYKTAQMIALPDVTRICGEKAGQLVRDLAQGAGCPEEFVLMPLLTCCSGDSFSWWMTTALFFQIFLLSCKLIFVGFFLVFFLFFFFGSL